MSALSVSAFFLAAIWGVTWASAIQFVPLFGFIAAKRTWLSVVVGVGVDLLIGLMAAAAARSALEAWGHQAAIIALSSLGIITRSLVNEYREHRGAMDAAQVPDNCADGLEDILALCIRARGNWSAAMARANALSDIQIALSLGRLRDDMAEIERKARMQGKTDTREPQNVDNF